MNIDLSRPEKLPERFKFRLRSIDQLCHEYEFSEELVKHPKVSPIVRDLDEYCRSNEIVGIHYTRTDPEKIRKKGLLIRSGKEIRVNFLKEYGHLFSETEVEMIKEKWLNYFDSQQTNGRDGKIFLILLLQH